MTKLYDGILPNPSRKDYLGYYPVTSKEEWDELPDVYKVMEWDAVKDPHHHGQLRAVKSVIFDATYIDPYGIHGQVYVHPADLQKILFCSYGKTDCLLYSVSGIELEGGTRLGARWMQDSISGAFAIYTNSGTPVARQGGFGGYIPDCIQKTTDGTFKYNFQHQSEKVCYYTLSNPFDSFYFKQKTKENADSRHGNTSDSLESKIQTAAALSHSTCDVAQQVCTHPRQASIGYPPV